MRRGCEVVPALIDRTFGRRTGLRSAELDKVVLQTVPPFSRQRQIEHVTRSLAASSPFWLSTVRAASPRAEPAEIGVPLQWRSRTSSVVSLSSWTSPWVRVSRSGRVRR